MKPAYQIRQQFHIHGQKKASSQLLNKNKEKGKEKQSLVALNLRQV
jgi:hypothetical protein